MGRQVNYFALEQDFALLESIFLSIQKFVVLHTWSPTATFRVAKSVVSAREEDPYIYYYLARHEDLKHVRVRHVPERAEYRVDDTTSPVIECGGPGFLRDGFLSRSRLYYQTGTYNSAGEWVSFSTEFIKWGEALFRRVKKCFPERMSFFYIGPYARKWADETGGKFRT